MDTEYHCKYTLSQQKQWIAEWVKKFHSPLFICSGNHDEDDAYLDMSLEALFDLGDEEYFDPADRQGWITTLNNEQVATDGVIRSLHGITIGCVPYGETDLGRYYSCDVLLTHVPPANTLTAKCNGTDFGDSMLQYFGQFLPSTSGACSVARYLLATQGCPSLLLNTSPYSQALRHGN